MRELLIAAALILTPAVALAQKPVEQHPDPAGATPLKDDAVYRALGEREGVERIMDDFIVRITTDPRIKDEFEGSNLARLKLMLTDQVCYLAGGPCQYKGKDMTSAHAGMNLTEADFNALAEDLQLSMDAAKVPFFAQNRLIAKLAPQKRQMVTN